LAVADQLPDGQAMIRLFDRRQDDRWRLRVYDNGSLLGLPYDAHMIAAEAVDYTTNDLPDGLRDGPVSIRAERLLAAEAGSYRMSVESHGGVRLWVGDRLLLDSWHAERVSSKQDIDLMPGYYPLVLELHGETNDLNIHLGGWRVRMLYVAYLPSVSDSE